MSASYICGMQLSAEDLELLKVKRAEYATRFDDGLEYVTDEMCDVMYYSNADADGYLVDLAEKKSSNQKHGCDPGKIITIYNRNGSTEHAISAFTYESMFNNMSVMAGYSCIVGVKPIVGTVFRRNQNKFKFTEVQIVGLDYINSSLLWDDMLFCYQIAKNEMLTKLKSHIYYTLKIKKINKDICRRIMEIFPDIVIEAKYSQDKHLYNALMSYADKV